MKKILEIETIYNAFMDTIMKKLPKKEEDYPEWYKDRLNKCNLCKYNTKNIPKEFIPTGGLYFSKIMGKPRCSICTCFIRQKAWSKTEMCALGETPSRPSWLTPDYLGDDFMAKPKWHRLELITSDSDDFNVLSTDGKRYNVDLSKDGNSFVIDLGKVKHGEDVEFSFILESKKPVKIARVRTSCGCTNVSMDFIDELKYKCHIKVKTSDFIDGIFLKQVRFCYFKGNKEDKENIVSFNIQGIISN